MIRTRNFSGGPGVLVYNNGWTVSRSIGSCPKNTDWKHMELVFTAFPSKRDLYGIAVAFRVIRGEIEVAALELKETSPAPGSTPDSAGFKSGEMPAVPFVPAPRQVNLLRNPLFESEQGAFPEPWETSTHRQVRHAPSTGPDGKAMVELRGSAKLWQSGLRLYPGEKYKLSALIRTGKLQPNRTKLLVHNERWFKADGIQSLPSDTGEWRRITKEITTPSATTLNFNYSVILYSTDPESVVSVAEIALEPLSKNGLEFAEASAFATRFLIPLFRTRRISADSRLLSFAIGKKPDKWQGEKLLYRIDGKSPAAAQVKDGEISIPFSETPGEHALAFSFRAKDGKEESAGIFKLWVLDKVPAPNQKIVRKNNLVQELLRLPLAGSGKQTFTALREGWIHLSFPKTYQIALDGKDISGPFSEVVRLVEAGKHEIGFRGTGPGELLVHSIPEILSFPANHSSPIKEYGSSGNGEEFMKKYECGIITVLTGGKILGDLRKITDAAGIRSYDFFNVFLPSVWTPENAADVISNSRTVKNPHYYFSGATADEVNLRNSSRMALYTRALQLIRWPEGKPLLTWCYGKPENNALARDFISMVVNTSGGNGKLLYEAYCEAFPTEKEAEKCIENMYVRTAEQFQKFYPEINESLGMIAGIYNQPPIMSLEFLPEIDYKYYLDMQFHVLANHPAFRDLAGIGVWGGLMHSDEEIVRWSVRLLRHYAVEGNTEMLSPRYGFRYTPGYLKNCDFTDGLKEWTVKGTARQGYKSEFGRKAQGRHQNRGLGDFFCVLEKQEGETTSISQKARGIQAGKTYVLQYITADADDVDAEKYAPRNYPVKLVASGIKIHPEKSWCHVDQRRTNYWNQPNFGRINLHRVIFTATENDPVLTFQNEQAKTGEKNVLGFVQLRPYYSAE